MTGQPPKYRAAQGSDRCDGCFFRQDDGTGCARFTATTDYRPSFVCDDFAMRSMAQRYDEHSAEAQVPQQESAATPSPPSPPATPPTPPPSPVTPPPAVAAHRQFATLRDIEIFKVGTWNGKKYTAKDLDSMIDAAGKIGFKPPVKLGHTEEPGAPAYGYVVNVRRDGDTLLADFEDVPDELIEQIREKRYDQVSSEIYFGVKRDKETFPLALRAVAILGAHPPGVADLRPLSAALAQHAVTAEFAVVDLSIDQLHPTAATVPAQEPPAMTTPNPAQANNAAAGNAVTTEPSAEIARLQAELAAARATAEAASTSQLTIQRLQEQVQHSALALRTIHEQARLQRIDTVVNSLNRPAWRGHIRALADLGTRKDDPNAVAAVVKFQATGASEATDTDALGVIEDLVRLLNSNTAHLFTEQVASGNLERSVAGNSVDDPGAVLYQLIQDYVAQHPGVNVDTARHTILNDPKHRDTVRRYNQAAVQTH